MDLPSQPPSDRPSPPPGPEAIRSQILFRCILAVGIISLILSAAMVLAPVFIKDINRRNLGLVEASNNAKQIHIALLDFNADYGSFPDATTIVDVKVATSTSLPLGVASSNEIFRQLLASVARSETMFWAKSTITPRKPDDVMSGGRALEKGECAFAYVAGLSSSSNSGTPVLMAPMDPGKRCFERRKDYLDKAVIVFVDGSTKHFPIDKHGKVQLGGMDIFDPRQPFWGGKGPDVKWPE
jgi:hypothetical protein